MGKGDYEAIMSMAKLIAKSQEQSLALMRDALEYYTKEQKLSQGFNDERRAAGNLDQAAGFRKLELGQSQQDRKILLAKAKALLQNSEKLNTDQLKLLNKLS